MQSACRGSRCAAHATPPIPVILIIVELLQQQFESDAATEVKDGPIAPRLEGPAAISSLAHSAFLTGRKSAFHDVTKGAHT